MRNKLKAVFGIGLTLFLLVSLTVGLAIPASALSQATVAVTNPTISATTPYTITFQLGQELPGGGSIIIDFPADTNASESEAEVYAVGTAAFTSGNTAVVGAVTAWTQAMAGRMIQSNKTSTWYTIASVETATTLTLTANAAAAEDGVTVGYTIAAVKVGGTSGIGSVAFPLTGATSTYSADTQTLTVTQPSGSAIGVGATVQVVVSGVVNASDPGDYTLKVSTSAETTAVTSAIYTLVAPTVGGGVYVYNASGLLLDTFGGRDALNTEYAGQYYDNPDYTIEVGPGTFKLTDGINITGKGLTFKSTDGAATTIIDCAAYAGQPAIHITASDVTVEGFTLDGYTVDGIWIKQGADGATVKNNIFSDGGWSGIVLEGEYPAGVVVTGATISGNVFQDCYTAITMLGGATDNTISDNTITGCTDTVTAITVDGGSSIGIATQGNTISGNTITDNAGSGIWLFDQENVGGFLDDNVIEGNTISGNAGNGIVIASTAENVTNLVITENDITDNEGVGILVDKWDASNAIKFNNLTRNDVVNGYGIENNADANTTVDAALNWWGTAVKSDIADMISGTGVTYEPFLAGTQETVFSATKVATGLNSLDARDDTGVVVSTTVNTDPAGATYVISAAEYAANPTGLAPEYSVVGSYRDVYVAGTYVTGATLKLFASGITGSTTAYAWSDTQSDWVACSDQSPSVFGGYVRVTIDETTMPTIGDLSGTPFVLVEAPALVASLDLTAPAAGGTGTAVSNTPFTWKSVDEATSYKLVVSENADLSLAVVEASATGTAYTSTKTLDYSTPYYWQVTALKDGAVVGESDVATFTTMGVAPPPPATQPPITIPPAQNITPAWIWAIVIIGAILVISVVVLIVTTRRTP